MNPADLIDRIDSILDSDLYSDVPQHQKGNFAAGYLTTILELVLNDNKKACEFLDHHLKWIEANIT